MQCPASPEAGVFVKLWKEISVNLWRETKWEPLPCPVLYVATLLALDFSEQGMLPRTSLAVISGILKSEWIVQVLHKQHLGNSLNHNLRSF